VLSLLVLAGVFLVFRTAFSVVLPAGSLLGPYTPELLK
jgi:putative tricarboxylic transport membrane protein